MFDKVSKMPHSNFRQKEKMSPNNFLMIWFDCYALGRKCVFFLWETIFEHYYRERARDKQTIGGRMRIYREIERITHMA